MKPRRGQSQDRRTFDPSENWTKLKKMISTDTAIEINIVLRMLRAPPTLPTTPSPSADQSRQAAARSFTIFDSSSPARTPISISQTAQDGLDSRVISSDRNP
jgi:hypothetical protein